MIGTQFNPKVSIVIPVYNGANYMREAIDSALDQTYQNIEVLVINDGSDDQGRTDKLAKSYGNKIKYFFKENGGVSTALNFGIKKMTGEYFSWLSHDDVYYPNKLEMQINFLKENNFNLLAIFGDYDIIDSGSDILYRNKIDHIQPHDLRFTLLSGYNPINGCTVLIHKNIFQKIGLFNEKLPTVQDFEMWYRISEHFDFFHLNNFLIKSRFHDEQGIVTKKSHFSEKQSFIYDSIKKVTAEELLLISGEQSVTAAYTKLAIKNKLRTVSQASLLASKLAKQNLLKDQILTVLKNMIMISYCDTYNFLVRILNKLNLINSVQSRFLLKRKKQILKWKS
ncbi:glycosyltransferase [Thermodesulfobacteriota bacterium]